MFGLAAVLTPALIFGAPPAGLAGLKHSDGLVAFPRGVAHCLRNTGNAPLRLLSCCSPAYRHEDAGIVG